MTHFSDNIFGNDIIPALSDLIFQFTYNITRADLNLEVEVRKYVSENLAVPTKWKRYLKFSTPRKYILVWEEILNFQNNSFPYGDSI